MEAKEKAALAPNIPTLLDGAFATNAHRNILGYTEGDSTQWHYLTGEDVKDRVDAVARGLIGLGIKVGDRVGIMCRTRYEWTILDFGIWAAGAIPVPIYDTSSAEQVDWISSDSGMELLFVETKEHLSIAHSVAKGQSPLKDIRCIDHGALEEVAKAGARVTDAELAKRKAAAKHGDLATIVYTSGTTGRPKGVRLTHFSYVRHVAGVDHDLHDVLHDDDPSTVLFLTLAHSLARLVELVFFATGVRVGFCPDPTRLVAVMGTFHPSLVVAVPRVFEKVYNSAEQKAEAGGKGAIFRWAVKQAVAYSEALDTPSGPSGGLKIRHRIADRLVLHKIANVLGGRARWAVSGSAPLGERLGHFYRGLGLVVLEGYGLTETNAASHVNRPAKAKIGTVGAPLPGIEVTIADDGEILMRGDTLFDGYHHNPEATKASMKNGWFLTGDVGHQDADGYLTITGRKKEIIVTAGGKNVAPAPLEDRLRSNPLVSQCTVVGDKKPFIAALITLDAEALPGWLKAHGHPDMTVEEARASDIIRKEIDAAVEYANLAVSRAESIRKYQLLEADFTVMNGYLTPSMKVKRAKVLADFDGQVEEMYAGVAARD